MKTGGGLWDKGWMCCQRDVLRSEAERQSSLPEPLRGCRCCKRALMWDQRRRCLWRGGPDVAAAHQPVETVGWRCETLAEVLTVRLQLGCWDPDAGSYKVTWDIQKQQNSLFHLNISKGNHLMPFSYFVPNYLPQVTKRSHFYQNIS